MSEKRTKEECLKHFKEIMMDSTVCVRHTSDDAFSTGRDKNDEFQKSLMEYEVNKIISGIQNVQEDCTFYSKKYGGLDVYFDRNRVYIFSKISDATNEYY